MAAKTFEELECWQLARELNKLTYEFTLSVQEKRDYGFADQMRRASISVMNNIAEGFERDTNVDFVRFLFTAKASAGEVRSMAYAGLDLEYFTEQEFEEIKNLGIRCSKATWGLIKSLKKNASWRSKAIISVMILVGPIMWLKVQG